MRHTLLALVLLFLSACIVDANSDAATGADQGPVFLIDMGQPDAQTDLPPETSADLTEMGPAVEAARPLFSLEAATSDDDTFYDFPIPSDLRLDPQGRPDIEHMPGANNVALIKNLREYVRTGLPGFAPHITSYVRFSAPIDSSDLGRSIDPTNPDAPIWLVDVDPDSPAFGTKLPIDVKVFTESTLYWRPNTLSARPIPGARLRPGGTYALLVRDRLTSASGAPVAPAPAFQALVEDTSGEDPISRHYADLFERLRQLDIDPADLLVASMYTTSDPRPQMDALASAAQGVTLEPLGPWQPVGLEDDSTLWRGSFTTTDFMSGPPPFDDPGEGRIEFDDQGDPVPQRTASVRISVRVPNGPVPPNGFPLLVYSHGTGGDAYSGTGASFSVGKQLASSGIATVGFDGALHGIRTTKEFDYASRALSNLMSVREMIRQSVVDEIILLRLIQQGMFRIPAATAERPDDITFRTDPWIMGHSQGGEQNGILVGLDIPFEGAYFSAAPAGLYILLVDQIYEGTNLGCALGVLASVDCPNVRYEHPAVSLLYQQTHSVNDPLNYASRALLERPEDWGPAPHTVLTEGLEDIITPPDSLEALAAVLGVPIVEPQLRSGAALSFLDVPTTPDPIQANFTVPGSGRAITAGLFQFGGLNHFAIFRDASARQTYRSFFSSGMLTNEAPRATRNVR